MCSLILLDMTENAQDTNLYLTIYILRTQFVVCSEECLYAIENSLVSVDANLTKGTCNI